MLSRTSNRRTIALAVVALAALTGAIVVTTAGGGKAAWRGDYESGDFSQWYRLQAVPGRAAIVHSPVRQGRFAARYVVQPGDDPINSSGERAEVQASEQQTGGYEGTEAWYRWFTLFPTDFNPVPNSSWNVFTQWHGSKHTGCGPNVMLQVTTKHVPAMIKFRVRGGRLPSSCEAQYDRSWLVAPLRHGRWYEFVFHVRWSSDASDGFVELWVDGKRAVPRTETATLYQHQSVYLKEGFYRAPSAFTSMLYQDGMTRADSCRGLFSARRVAAPCRGASQP